MGLPVLTDSLQGYLSEINRYPILSQEEEFKVAERYYRLKRLDDAHTLVVSNLRYVVKIAFEYRNYGCKVADLIQEGNIGLMVAVKKFNPHKGFRLITYATWWIRSFIQDFVLKTKGIVRRGTKALKKRLFYKNRPGPYELEEKSLSSPAARAEKGADAPFEFSNDLSLNNPIKEDDTSFLDMLSDGGPGQEETFSGKQEERIVKREVNDALALLNPKERMVIENRLMSDEPASLQGLGERLGLTRERVRQIESAALKKLQKTLSNKLALPRDLPA